MGHKRNYTTVKLSVQQINADGENAVSIYFYFILTYKSNQASRMPSMPMSIMALTFLLVLAATGMGFSAVNSR